MGLKGKIALCSRGMLGLITEDEPKQIRYSDETFGLAYVGVYLQADSVNGIKIGDGWSSRDPKVVGELPSSDKPVYAAGASVLVTNSSGQLLLARRKNNSGEGFLSTPGGRIEYDETVEQCAAREFKEECLAELGPVELIGWKKHNRYGKHYFMFYFLATSWTGEIKNGIPDKSEDWAWYDVNDISPANCTEPADIVQILTDRGYLWYKGRD